MMRMDSDFGRRVLINQHYLYVESFGVNEHPTIILLHHGLGSTKSWTTQTDALVQAGFHVVVYDRWGYGRSERRAKLNAPYFEDDLSDLLSLCNYIEKDRLILIGHSDGGTISLYFASIYPELMNSLVIISAHCYVEPKMIPGMENIHSAYEKDIRFRKGLERLHDLNANDVFYHWYQAWTKAEILNWDMRPVLSKIQCKTFVVQGIEDEYATPEHAREIFKAIKNAEIWLVPKANHMVVQEMPQVFNAKVLDFLSRNSSLIYKDRYV